MTRTPFVTGGIALLVFLGLSPGGAQAAAQAAPTAQEKKQEKAAVALCGDCHEQAKTFSTNAHAYAQARAEASPNAACESCHGDGTKHMEAGGDKALIGSMRGRPGADACLTCHDTSKETKSFRNGTHASSRLEGPGKELASCSTCHSIHSASPKARHLLVKEQVDLCATCHPSQAATLRTKPFTHRTGRAGLACSSCHDPHGRPGDASLKLSVTGQLPCVSCHAEKKGPFVFEHVNDVAGNCLTCHEPHGSSNPKMLKRASVDRLCLECHSRLSPQTLGSQPPATHNLLTARYRNCTTCHIAIHGSNRSPRLLK